MSATTKSQMEQAPQIAAPWVMAPLMDMPLTVGSELLRFTSHRLQAQAELWASLAHCASLSEVAELEAEFIDVAMSEYAREAATLFSKAQDIGPKQAA